MNWYDNLEQWHTDLYYPYKDRSVNTKLYRTHLMWLWKAELEAI